MVTSNPRALELDEEAVVDAIIFQRVDSDTDSNIVKYDEKKIRARLRETGNSSEHKITLGKQRKIIMKLCDDGILNTDWIVDVEWHNNVYPHINPNSVHLNTKAKYLWANQTKWAHEDLQLNGLIPIEDVYMKDGACLYVRMTDKDIDNIDYYYKASHTIEPKLIKSPKDLKTRFCVVIDGGKPICISELRADKKPLKILALAFRNMGNDIYRSDLIRYGILSQSDSDKSLKSDIFKDNKHILDAAPFLLEIHSDRIMIKNPQRVTLDVLNQLKTKLKIA